MGVSAFAAVRTVLFVFCVYSSTALSDEEIIGAFGVNLGQNVRSVVQNLSPRQFPEGSPGYSFTPVQPAKYFKDYYFYATPSGLIYGIYGKTVHKPYRSCMTALDDVVKLVRNKYVSASSIGRLLNRIEEKEINKPFGDQQHGTKFIKKPRSITLFCRRITELKFVDNQYVEQPLPFLIDIDNEWGELVIAYIDEELSSMDDAERLNQRQKVNPF